MDLWQDFAGGMLRAHSIHAIGTLLIDNPRHKNAMTAAMWRAVPQAMRWLTDETHVRVVIIRGAGTVDFCAGADISEFETVRKDTASALFYEGQNSEAFEAIRHCRVPTIVAIRGVCFGGGFGIAAACDLRIADDGARFAIPAATLGLAYPADAVHDIVNALGAQMTKVALFTGAPVSASRMAAAGFLLEIVSADMLDAEVATLAEAIAANAPISIQASKIAVRAVIEQDNDLLREAEVIGASTFESADYAEGRAAFAQKRKPQFTGK